MFFRARKDLPRWPDAGMYSFSAVVGFAVSVYCLLIGAVGEAVLTALIGAGFTVGWLRRRDG